LGRIASNVLLVLLFDSLEAHLNLWAKYYLLCSGLRAIAILPCVIWFRSFFKWSRGIGLHFFFRFC